MIYLKAYDVFQVEVVELIQKYIDGEAVYIPRKIENKKSWGENTDTKKYIIDRNRNIYLDYTKGVGIEQLAEKYFLTSKSIQRILHNEKNK